MLTFDNVHSCVAVLVGSRLYQPELFRRVSGVCATLENITFMDDWRKVASEGEGEALNARVIVFSMREMSKVCYSCDGVSSLIFSAGVFGLQTTKYERAPSTNFCWSCAAAQLDSSRVPKHRAPSRENTPNFQFAVQRELLPERTFWTYHALL